MILWAFLKDRKNFIKMSLATFNSVMKPDFDFTKNFSSLRIVFSDVKKLILCREYENSKQST